MRCRKLRPSRPAPISSTSETASCTTTSAPRRRALDAPPAIVRWLSFEPREGVGLHRARGREHAEEQGGHEGDGEREREDRPAHGDVVEPRQAARFHLQQAAHAHGRHEHAEEPARDGQHERLAEERRQQLHAARAERRAYRQLALTRRRARQQQVDDVGAGDEEQAADRAEEDEEERPDATDQLIVQRHDCDVHHRRVIAVLLLEPLRDAAQIAARLLQCRPVAQAADDAPVVRGA